jgi:hypothetical protein
MPASWWERMLLGTSDDAIGSEDARLVFTHLLHWLVDQETATNALRQPAHLPGSQRPWVDRVDGLESVQIDIAMMRTPDSANHSKSLGQDYMP